MALPYPNLVSLISVYIKISNGNQWRPYMEAKGAFAPPVFFICPFLKTLPRLKLPLLAFTHYPLWGLKNLPPLNFKLSPPLVDIANN